MILCLLFVFSAVCFVCEVGLEPATFVCTKVSCAFFEEDTEEKNKATQRAFMLTCPATYIYTAGELGNLFRRNENLVQKSTHPASGIQHPASCILHRSVRTLFVLETSSPQWQKTAWIRPEKSDPLSPILTI